MLDWNFINAARPSKMVLKALSTAEILATTVVPQSDTSSVFSAGMMKEMTARKDEMTIEGTMRA
eukprot:CAMPEP_0180624082 /NCGR_PEP_ID=MMETSP1037_2-20121125/36580_1 /TAXON_ID=632150 /ORGANISM="Azadinium spinosum, Strain 3D9" /LENGTH=63 /DNA_ID=CAMNT_0022644477 /DNA_START=256 /DNA_END=450 /DNA_ORIENTATION=+